MDWIAIINQRIGYAYATACIMAFTWEYFASAILSRPFARVKNIAIFICLSLIFTFWNIVGGLDKNLYLIGYYSGYALILMLVYKQSWQNAIYYALIYFFAIGYVSRIIRWIYNAAGGSYYVVEGSSFLSEPWIYLCTAAMMLTILYFVRPQVRKIADYDLKKLNSKEYIQIMFMALPLAYFCYNLTFLSGLLVDLSFGDILIRSMTSVGVMVALFGLVSSRKQQQELEELRSMEQRLQEQYKRHLIKTESSELVMQRYHDLQKHLQFFQETSNKGNLAKYQAELKETIDNYDSVYETGNPTLDTILSEKCRECRGEGIHLICMADGNLINFMDPIDICTIFGNALDNAIESAQTLAHPEKKIIRLKISQEKYLLLIRFENYYEHELFWQDDKLLTGKPDKADHGYGLKSIEYAAGKYNGNTRITAGDGMFTLTVLINR